jgi:hypothetical protein
LVSAATGGRLGSGAVGASAADGFDGPTYDGDEGRAIASAFPSYDPPAAYDGDLARYLTLHGCEHPHNAVAVAIAQLVRTTGGSLIHQHWSQRPGQSLVQIAQDVDWVGLLHDTLVARVLQECGVRVKDLEITHVDTNARVGAGQQQSMRS